MQLVLNTRLFVVKPFQSNPAGFYDVCYGSCSGILNNQQAFAVMANICGWSVDGTKTAHQKHLEPEAQGLKHLKLWGLCVFPVILLVYAGIFLIHRRSQRDTILSEPPGGTAGHLSRGQQCLTVAAVRLKRHRHICRDRASESDTAGTTGAELSKFVTN